MAKNRPVHEVRVGRIKSLVWANATASGIKHNVTVSRLYKDGQKWRTSENFSQEDLPTLCKVLDLTHTWIFEETVEPPRFIGTAAAG